jgi:hypothetical protein
MRNLWGRFGSVELRHPPDETLVAYLDGELAARKYRQVEAHLAGCWNCRRRREKLEHAIGEFVDYMGATCPPPPRAWRNFERGLEERAAPAEVRAPFWRGFAVPMRALEYGAAAVVLGVALWSWLAPGTVSAKELLDRGIRAESTAMERASQRVVYQKLRVHRTCSRSEARAGAVEIWRDPAAPRFRQVAEDALWGELERVLVANGMDPARPLSPAGYGQWRDRLPRREETVSAVSLPGGASALALATAAPGPHREGAIVEASLVLRSADWHPMRESLKVQGAGELFEYEMTEVAFDLRPVDPALFASDRTPSVPAAPAAQPLAPPPVTAPTTLDPGSIEVQAWYTLHRLRACLGEPIQVVREPSGRVAVEGLAETPARKQELLAALGRIPGLKIELRTPEEYMAQARPAAAAHAPAASTSQPAEPEKAVLPIQGALSDYFRKRAEPGEIPTRIASLSSDAISLAGTYLAEAWSLRRLADAYPSERIAALDAAHHRLLEDMFRDHAAALREALARSSTLLDPVLAAIAPAAGAAHAGLTTPADPCTILEAAQVGERLTRVLLAGANDAQEAPEKAAGRLLESLRQAYAKSVALEAALKGGLAARECHCRLAQR